MITQVWYYIRAYILRHRRGCLMQKLSVNFDANGLIESVVVDGVTVMMSQNLMWYAGMNEGNANSIFDDRPSGAYVFRPNGTDATPISTQATLIVQTGSYKYPLGRIF